MFTDFNRTVSALRAADVCIVGAGAAGIAIASELCGTDCKVLLVESGNRRFNRRTQKLYAGENAGLPSFSTESSRFRMFGGSTTQWGGKLRPLDEVDFEQRRGVPLSGWPFSRSMLDPWYRRAQSFCNLAGDFDLANWSASNGGPLPIDSKRLSTQVYRFLYPSDLGVLYADRLAEADNVDVLLNGNLTHLALDPSGNRVKELTIRSLTGQTQRIEAKAVVLACGGIENPRLLLASNDVAKNGIGNGYDVVGRYFMDHPMAIVGRFAPASAQFDHNYYTIEDYNDVGIGQKMHAGLTLSEDLVRSEELNQCALYMVRRPYYKTTAEYYSTSGTALNYLVDVVKRNEPLDRSLKETVGRMLSGPRDLGRTLGRLAAHQLQRRFVAGLRVEMESRPLRESHIRLSKQRDALGMPKVEVNWQIHPDDRRGLDRLLEEVQVEFQRAEIGEIVLFARDRRSQWPRGMTGAKHHMGATRMHRDPQQGVVDENCRVHSVDNLYVAGTSVFPTGGYANPGLTLLALALRLADHLKATAGIS